MCTLRLDFLLWLFLMLLYDLYQESVSKIKYPMKQLFILFCLVWSFFSFPYQSWYAQDCDFDGEIISSLDNCLEDSDLVNPWDGLLESGVKDQLVYWVMQLWGLLGLLAVWSLVYGALMMTLSGWDDEKVKKWKDIVKWTLLGFLVLISAGALIRLVIEVVFSFSS